MNITKGKIHKPQKVVIYGSEGIGKSTFASRFPLPLFIDIEGSTYALDVARMDRPTSWTMLLSQVQYVKQHPQTCRTLIIDTADWAEELCIDHICAQYKKTGIEEFGYGKGYTYLSEEFGRLLNQLQEVIEAGVNVVMTAHAWMRKFEQPDELGAYDRWEMKLGKKTAPLVKEWADILLFANYKTVVINVDNQGASKGKNKAQGGQRVMYTAHHACWDAKNRHGLPEELPFDYSYIAAIIECEAPTTQPTTVSIPDPAPVPVQRAAPAPDTDLPTIRTNTPDAFDVPRPLLDLMRQHNVSIASLQQVIANRGYYPLGTAFKAMEPGFLDNLVSVWPQVMGYIAEMNGEVPADVPFTM